MLELPARRISSLETSPPSPELIDGVVRKIMDFARNQGILSKILRGRNILWNVPDELRILVEGDMALTLTELLEKNIPYSAPLNSGLIELSKSLSPEELSQKIQELKAKILYERYTQPDQWQVWLRILLLLAVGIAGVCTYENWERISRSTDTQIHSPNKP